MSAVVLIDTGTTNTRVWRVENGQPVLRLDRAVGVRDTAVEGSPARLHAALRELLDAARARHADAVVAAGMATSPLGIASAGHVHAPASVNTIAAGSQWATVASISDCPILLVPGVRTHGAAADPASGAQAVAEAALDSDVMRGEETLALGLIAAGTLAPTGVLLTFGSHWKAIGIDADGRIAWSRTAVTGELFEAARTHTVLASSLAGQPPGQIDDDWCDAGAHACSRHGLARTLFGIRLLEQSRGASVPQRYAYLLGALAADAWPALAADRLAHAPAIVATGHAAACQAIARVAAAHDPAIARRLRVVTSADVEQAWISGAIAVWRAVRDR